MARIIQFEGRQISLPDDATDAEVAQALGGAATPTAAPAPTVAEMPQQPSPAASTPSVGRQLQIGTQGAGAGLAELAAMPFDLAAGAQNALVAGINKLIGTNIPMATPASSMVKEGASRLSEAAGMPTINEGEMQPRERLAYNINRFGAQAAGAIPALATRAATRSAEIAAGSAPKAFDALVKPYAGENVGRTVVGDAAASAGAGTGVTLADEAGYKDNPIVQTLAALMGGLGGMTIPQVVERGARGIANAAGRPFGYNIDKNIAVDPATGNPVTKTVSDRASQMVQDAAVDPTAATTRMQTNSAELRGLSPDAPMPSPAALSEDPGLAALERKVRMANTGEAVARDRQFNSAVRDTVDQVAPPEATAQPLIDRVRKAAGDRTAVAERGVQRAEGQSRSVEMARAAEGEASVLPFEGRSTAASQRLDRVVVDETYVPWRAEKNRQFDTAPGRTQQIPADDIFAAAAEVRQQNNALRPDNQLPEDFIRRLEALAPDIQQQRSPILDASGQPIVRDVNVGGEGTALGGDLADTRKYIRTAIDRARASSNFDMVDSLTRLGAAVNRTIESAPGYAEANNYYRQGAAVFRPSPKDPMAEFTRAIDRDPGRGSTPPSETASRFIQPQAPEAQQALRRVIEAGADPAAGRASAREYLMSDMAAAGIVDRKTGAIRPDRLRQWQTRWGDLEGVVPGFQAELRDMTARAQRGERISGQMADQVKAAQQNLKQTQTEIDKGALGLVLNADPDKAVAAVMSQTNRTGKLLDELIRVAKTDPTGEATNGLKAAVRDYLVEKATTGASEKLKPGDRRGPVSQAKLSAIFREHEKQLAQVFSPEEMNTLRAGNRALELANIERLRVSSGSDTAEKATGVVEQFLNTGVGRGVEAALRLKYGLLKAGGIVSTTRRLTSGVTGGPSPDDVVRLVERASVDPELMGLLLGRKLPVGSPAWNGKMQRLLAVAEGARDSAPAEQK